MKKILYFVIIFFFAFILVGCGKDNENKLQVPENLRIDGDVVKWSIVEGASQYVVTVNLDEYQTDTNSFNLAALKLAVGTYDVKVKAQGDGVTKFSSDYSKAVQYVVEQGYVAPVSRERYIVRKENFETNPVLQFSYSEEQYNIFIYYLGKIESVPLAYGAAEEYDGLSDRVIKLSKSSITENSVTESKNYCYTQTNIVTNQTTQNTGVNINVGGGAGPVKAEGTISYSIGKVKTEENSSSSSFSDAYSAVQSYAETQGEERTYTINQNYEAGYFYRVALLGDCDLFAFLVYDCIENTITVQYDLAPISNSLYYTIEKNDDNVFDSTSSYKDEINFDPNIAIEKGILNYIKESKDLGTKDDPYVISNPSELVAKLRNDNIGVYYILTADIDFKGREFSYYYTPIEELKGIILGNGYSIKNYELSLIDNENSGFFKQIANSGRIQDVIFDNCIFNTVKNTGTNNLYAGIVCGTNNGVISNVIVKNSKIEKINLGSLENSFVYTVNAGIVCGLSESGSVIEKVGVVDSIINCTVETKYEKAISFVGGLAGVSNTRITNCYVRGVTLNGNAAAAKRPLNINNGVPTSYVGGLVAKLSSGNSIEYCLVNNLQLTSNVKVDSDETKGNKSTDVPLLEGSLNQCVFSNTLPDSFPKDYWEEQNGVPVIKYQWK